MEKNRYQLLQALIKKFEQIIKGLHANHNFPFGRVRLSHRQAMVLFFINKQQKKAAIKDLSEFFNITPGAITQLVDSLVKKGLIERETDPRDRRSVRIKLTISAKKLFTDFQKKYLEAAGFVFADLKNSEIAQLIKLLEKIKQI